MYQGLSLLFVGAVLCLNGLWQLNYIHKKEIWIINFFVGCLSLFIALRLAFASDADLQSVRAAGLTLLFSFTYFWVAINQNNSADGRGLGWFSLFISITILPVSLDIFLKSKTLWDYWQAFNWLAWSILWGLFFIDLALQKTMPRLIGWTLIVQGIFTAWLPSYLLLNGFI